MFSRSLLFSMILLAPGHELSAQLMLSGNEYKIDLRGGAPEMVSDAPPGSVSVLDFSSFPPHVRHLENITNTVIGPPSNIAISPDQRLALVADSIQGIDPQDPEKFIPNDRIHILDLSADPPVVVGHVTAGQQPSGMSISRDGRIALVANRASGTVSVLTLDGNRVRPVTEVKVCEPEESASDVAITPNGKLALVSVQNGGYLALLKIDGTRVTTTERQFPVYGKPYRVVITPDGTLGLTAGMGVTSKGLDADVLSVVDLSADPMRTVDHVTIAPVPESIEVSPDGKLLAAVCMAGSNVPPDNPHHRDGGVVVLLARRGQTYEPVQQIATGPIPEGVAFTADGRYLVVQSHASGELWIYRVNSEQLEDTGRADPGARFSVFATGCPVMGSARSWRQFCRLRLSNCDM